VSPAEVAWTRTEITHARANGVTRALDHLAATAATADLDPAPEFMREQARALALAELSLAHGHVVALEAQLFMAGAA